MQRSRARPATLALAVLLACDVGAPSRVQAPADSAAGEVPFRLAGPGGAALLVAVEIDGRGPFQLVLDTGATLTCLDQALVAELGLPQSRGVVGVGAGVGGSGRLRLHRVDSLRVGGARLEDLSVCALDLSHIAALDGNVKGLLGLNVLRNFRVTIDFERNVVRLEAPDADAR